MCFSYCLGLLRLLLEEEEDRLEDLEEELGLTLLLEDELLGLKLLLEEELLGRKLLLEEEELGLKLLLEEELLGRKLLLEERLGLVEGRVDCGLVDGRLGLYCLPLRRSLFLLFTPLLCLVVLGLRTLPLLGVYVLRTEPLSAFTPVRVEFRLDSLGLNRGLVRIFPDGATAALPLDLFVCRGT